MIFFDPPKALSLFVSSWTKKKDSAYISIHSLNIKKTKMHDRVSKQCWFGAIIQYPTHPTVLSLNLRGWVCESVKKVTQDMIWMNVWSVCRKGILITILSKIKIVSANDRLIECKLYSMGHSIKLANFTTVSIRKKKK
jgi:hypothetical protein